MSEKFHYNNNMWMYFEALRRRERGIKDKNYSEWLSLFKDLGEPWKKFYKEQPRLIEEIFNALEGVQDYLNKHDEYIELLNSDRQLAIDFGQVNLAPLEQNWQRINKILKRIGKVLKDYGIDENQFFD